MIFSLKITGFYNFELHAKGSSLLIALKLLELLKNILVQNIGFNIL